MRSRGDLWPRPSSVLGRCRCGTSPSPKPVSTPPSRAPCFQKSWKLVVDEHASPTTTSLYRYCDGELRLEDLSEERRAVSRRLMRKLRLWQVERSDRLPETTAWGFPSLKETEALRALGYLPEE